MFLFKKPSFLLRVFIRKGGWEGWDSNPRRHKANDFTDRSLWPLGYLPTFLKNNVFSLE